MILIISLRVIVAINSKYEEDDDTAAAANDHIADDADAVANNQ